MAASPWLAISRRCFRSIELAATCWPRPIQQRIRIYLWGISGLLAHRSLPLTVIGACAYNPDFTVQYSPDWVVRYLTAFLLVDVPEPNRILGTLVNVSFLLVDILLSVSGINELAQRYNRVKGHQLTRLNYMTL